MRKVTAKFSNLNFCQGTPLVVNWLWLHTSKAGGPGPTPGQGTILHGTMQPKYQKKTQPDLVLTPKGGRKKEYQNPLSLA